jgi:hypothetical protein
VRQALINTLGIALLMALALPSQAIDLGQKLQIHGFGSWAYGKTDVNRYLSGSSEGEYDHSEFYLNINAQPLDQLTISAQVGWYQDHDGTELDFDYAFAEWRFSEKARARAGRV